MKKKVCYEVDINNPLPLTDEQKIEIKKLAAMPKSEIDYSDIAPLNNAFWKNAVRNPLYKPTKTITTVRVDSDVLAWLKSQGKGYQTRINAILREAMLRSIR
ncbi:BrnA antitoxin family protein [Bartonella sp. CB60]|uniref:BrnA antitoxin family protein n=1 Tax=Bartonella sp. CB60 TaxID=3113619 RepID=UPI00300DD881